LSSLASFLTLLEWVYQDVLAEGEARGIAETLLRMVRKALGTPDERVAAFARAGHCS
jgi:hypothetical protein